MTPEKRLPEDEATGQEPKRLKEDLSVAEEVDKVPSPEKVTEDTTETTDDVSASASGTSDTETAKVRIIGIFEECHINTITLIIDCFMSLPIL